MASGSSVTPPAAGPPTAPATVLHGGQRIPLDGTLTIGRLPDNDVTIAKEAVSRHHARIEAARGGFWIADLGSRNGTRLNGERFSGESRWLSNGDSIVIGGETLRFLAGEETRAAAGPQQPLMGTRVVQFTGEQLTLGRDRSNDVVLDDPNVSRFHAEVRRVDGRAGVRDLASRNGTRVNGELVESALLEPGSEVGVGPYSLIFDGATFVARSEQGALRLDAERVMMQVGEKQILKETTLSIEPGEFVAFIGESGSGKTTLLKSLAGVTTPTSGTVALNGEPVASRLTDIGYLPQDEIVHPDLTVRESLEYSAELRLPADTSDDEIEATVERALEETGLAAHADTRIGSLSGGQRKRVGVATEVLSRPSLLFLDEPTTGLDPGLESKMMELFRDLAAANERAVTVVTHATKSLGLCDKLVVMGAGGIMCFHGTPDQAREFFGAETYDDIYVALAGRAAIEWQQQFIARGLAAPSHGERDEPPPKRRRVRGRGLHQTRVLTARYLKVFLRDRRNVFILLGQIPILGLAVAALFKSGVFIRPPKDAGQAVKLTFLLLVTTVWIGSIDSAREIIKEKGVFVRETAVGVKISAYLASKSIVLFALAAIQAVVLTGIVLAFQPLHEAKGVYGSFLIIVVLTAFAAVSMGLLVSAFVRSEDQATSFIPLILIPQLFFGGSIVATAEMSAPMQTATKAVVTQWSYAGMGAAIDMNGRIADDPKYGKVARFSHDYFTLSRPATYLILAGFSLITLFGVGWILRRRARAV